MPKWWLWGGGKFFINFLGELQTQRNQSLNHFFFLPNIYGWHPSFTINKHFLESTIGRHLKWHNYVILYKKNMEEEERRRKEGWERREGGREDRMTKEKKEKGERKRKKVAAAAVTQLPHCRWLLSWPQLSQKYHKLFSQHMQWCMECSRPMAHA